MANGPQRGGWRCSLCGITYPNDRDKFKNCIACGEPCSYISSDPPDEDWLEMATYLIMRWEGGDHNTIPTEWTQEAEPPEQDEPGTQESS